MIFAKFGWNWPSGSEENVKKKLRQQQQQKRRQQRQWQRWQRQRANFDKKKSVIRSCFVMVCGKTSIK